MKIVNLHAALRVAKVHVAAIHNPRDNPGNYEHCQENFSYHELKFVLYEISPLIQEDCSIFRDGP